MELRTLRYFVAIARQGSMTSAAQELFVSQPALSRQMSDLEAELGCSLFLRRGKRISLTEDGERFYPKAVEIIRMADGAKKFMSGCAEEIAGDVRIGIGESANLRNVFRIADETSRLHPKVRFDFTTGNSVDLRHKLVNGYFDYIFAYESGGFDQGLCSVRLKTTNRVALYVRRDHPLSQKDAATVEDLATGRIVASRQFMGSEEVRSWLGPVVDRLNVVATYNLPANAMLMVEEGLGDYLINYDDLVREEGTTLKRLELIDAPVSGEFLVWREDRKFSRAALLFKDSILDELASDIDQNNR